MRGFGARNIAARRKVSGTQILSPDRVLVLYHSLILGSAAIGQLQFFAVTKHEPPRGMTLQVSTHSVPHAHSLLSRSPSPWSCSARLPEFAVHRYTQPIKEAGESRPMVGVMSGKALCFAKRTDGRKLSGKY